MNRFAGEVVEVFLLWADRQREHGCFGQILSASFEDSLSRAFTAELKRRFPARHDDDVTNAGSWFFSRCPSLWEWYLELCEAHEITISFFGAEPCVEQEGFARWAHLVRRIDPDSVIAHALVSQGQETAVPRLTGWGTLVPSADRELRRLLRRSRLVDTHVHLSGCDPIAGLWQRLIGGQTRLHHLYRYRISTLASVDGAERSLRGTEMEIIAEGIRSRERLYRKFLSDTSFREQPDGSGSSPAPHLLKERRLLAWAWWRTKSGDRETAEALDRYLLAKNNFVYNHHQMPGVRPGLRSFREYLDQGEEWISKESRRIRRDRMERRVRFAAECRQLKRIEFRITPFSQVDQYVEFFHTWEALLRKNWGSTRPRITFVIHFLRPTKPDDDRERVPFEGLRRKLDRQTAVLHLFRRNCRDLARYITGIDVANLERDCPPEVFSPYLRFLRGDSAELQPGADALLYQCWLRILARGDVWHPVDLPRLYLTYHAGEDFYHPLQGMRDMDEIIEGAKMGAGDRLGHGLAAGWDFATFEQGRGANLQIPAGVLWDALVWALGRIVQGDLGGPRERWHLENLVDELSEAIYGNSLSVRLASSLVRSRHRVLFPSVGPSRRDIELRHRELFDPDCRRARRQLRPFPYKPVLHGLLEQVQEDFVRDLAQRRIVIEINPSSNLLVSGIPDLRHHPFFRLRKIAGPALAMSFNTDDPGVFATRIDAEYALMLDAMLANGMRKHECMEILEQVLEVAERSSFL